MTPDWPALGSLFSGYGGLDLAVEATLGARTVWHCENDPAASRVLATRWLGVPNLGDITRVRWSDVEPVDVLTGGFPCQDVSHAGRRAGLAPGTRSGLWAQMADVPGLSRNDQLRMLGNGVVPAQAAAAIRHLTPNLRIIRDPEAS